MSKAGDVIVDVVTQDDGWTAAIPDVERLAEAAAAAALMQAGYAAGPAELSVALAADAAVADLNRAWRGKSGPTNVLSFALAAADVGAAAAPVTALGDVVLARETTLAEAARDGRSAADHTAHLVVHGVLHLLGYDHTAEDAAQRMEAAETAALRALGRPDPYAPDPHAEDAA